MVSRRVTAGEVLGTVADGVMRFLGIPYAAPPFGPNRFALPSPVQPWRGARDATSSGPTAPQVARPYLPPVAPSVNDGEADILHVNVWAPAAPPAGGSPVFVWFHGGSLLHGANADAIFDGTRFAQRGIVVVTPNYRLGTEGFSVLDGAPTNLGLADHVAALRWVRDEIAAFGGDPEHVTVGGHSAAGSTVAAVMACPEAAGLFRCVIIQSGPLHAQPREQAGEVTRRMADRLGVPATREEFAQFSPAALLLTQHEVLGEGSPGDGRGFGLTIGDALVPDAPLDALRGGVADQVPLLIGVTSEEYRFWAASTGLLEVVTDDLADLVTVARGLPPSLVAAYRADRPKAKPGEILGMVLSDVLLRGPMIDVADARARRDATTHVYEFAWRSSRADLGAAHAVDLGFVFNTLDTPDARALTGDRAPQHLADEMHRAWARFISAGDPGWPAWDKTRPAKVFDGAGNPIVHDLNATEVRALLDALALRRGQAG